MGRPGAELGKAKTHREKNTDKFGFDEKSKTVMKSPKKRAKSFYGAVTSKTKTILNQDNGGQIANIDEQNLQPFSHRYDPSEYDKLSLAWRITKDFEGEGTEDDLTANAQEVTANARPPTANAQDINTQSGSRGAPNRLRAAQTCQVPAGGVRWVPIRDEGFDKKSFLLAQVTHGLAQKGISAGQFTCNLAKNVPGAPGAPAVLIYNKLNVPFQVSRGQRLGTLVPLQRLPEDDRGRELHPAPCYF
jgi:hypothetical protein